LKVLNEDFPLHRQPNPRHPEASRGRFSHPRVEPRAWHEHGFVRPDKHRVKVNKEPGEKTSESTPKRVKAWFRGSADNIVPEVRYGNVPIKFAPGKTAVEVGKAARLIRPFTLSSKPSRPEKLTTSEADQETSKILTLPA
jgi:hypothetical protein